jgi:hypothetical protein
LPLNKHHSHCKLFQEFSTFLREFKDTEEVKDDPWGFGDDLDDLDFEANMVAFDQKEEECVICCCKKEVPHDESMKFDLKADKKNLNTVLFK